MQKILPERPQAERQVKLRLALEKIAELALEQDTGARALQTIVDGMQNVILSNLRDPDITQIALDDEVLEKSRAIFYRKGATK